MQFQATAAPVVVFAHDLHAILTLYVQDPLKDLPTLERATTVTNGGNGSEGWTKRGGADGGGGASGSRGAGVTIVSGGAGAGTA